MSMSTQSTQAVRSVDRAGGRCSTRSSSSTRATQIRNPVMFVVFVGSILTTIADLCRRAGNLTGFIIGVTVWLWFTVLFANFAEAMAEGRGKAQADTLRQARRDTPAKKLAEPKTVLRTPDRLAPPACARGTSCSSKRAISFRWTAK